MNADFLLSIELKVGVRLYWDAKNWGCQCACFSKMGVPLHPGTPRGEAPCSFFLFDGSNVKIFKTNIMFLN